MRVNEMEGGVFIQEFDLPLNKFKTKLNAFSLTNCAFVCMCWGLCVRACDACVCVCVCTCVYLGEV